jgi:hypothetical protein
MEQVSGHSGEKLRGLLAFILRSVTTNKYLS